MIIIREKLESDEAGKVIAQYCDGEWAAESPELQTSFALLMESFELEPSRGSVEGRMVEHLKTAGWLAESYEYQDPDEDQKRYAPN